MFSDFFFGLLPVCRQTVETQRGKNTQIKKKRIERELKTTIQKSNKYKKYKKYTNKQTNPMVDSLSTIDISQTNIRQKKNPNTKKKRRNAENKNLLSAQSKGGRCDGRWQV